MVIATKTKSNQLQKSSKVELSSAALLLGLKKSFFKNYPITQDNISDDILAALLFYFALNSLEQNDQINAQHIRNDDNELLAQSNYLFDLLQHFLPKEIRTVMPAPNMAALQQAKLFYDGLKSDIKEALFQDIANLGFAFQIFNLGTRKSDALPNVQSANKTISRKQLIAFTQLYTPSWVVDFLISNTTLPLFPKQKEKSPSQHFDWLIPKEYNNSEAIDLANFKILDPACGAGQFLFSAFDLLLSMYDIAGYKREESVKLTLSNIYGADIDEKALWVAGLGLLCKSLSASKNPPETLPNLVWSGKNKEENFLGSIDRSWPQDHILTQTYHAIVTNPPYIGRKCLSRELKTALQEQYPDSSSDLCAAFLKRCTQMLKPGGRLGLITQASLLSIPSYQSLRQYLFNNYHFETIIRCGPRVFPLASGEKIDSVLLIAQAPKDNNKNIDENDTRVYDLNAEANKAEILKEIVKSTINKPSPESPPLFNSQTVKISDRLSFGLPLQLIEKFSAFPKLAEIAEIRQGLATTNNARFVRYHFDVDPNLIGSQWFPYIKGAGAEKFASENPFVVKWGNNGAEIKKAVTEAYPYLKGKTAWVVKNEEFYFRPGLCFSFINKSGLAVRRLPAGAIFDVGSSAIFAQPEEEDFLLAYLNSSLLGVLTKTINQTINVQVGDLKKLPVLPFTQELKDKIADLGKQCFINKQRLLELQKIDRQSMSEPASLISAQQLELFFCKHANEHKSCLEQLMAARIEIDSLINEGVKKLDILDKNEETFLNNIVLSHTVYPKESACDFDTKMFAYKILIALVSSSLSDNKYIERPKLVSKLEKFSLAQSLGLTTCGAQWLETILGQPLEQIFGSSFVRSNKVKIVDINKLAGESSRYFCLWLDYCNSYLFFSARAIYQILNSPETDNQSIQFWQPILQKLDQSEDWTSKDLSRFASIEAATKNLVSINS